MKKSLSAPKHVHLPEKKAKNSRAQMINDMYPESWTHGFWVHITIHVRLCKSFFTLISYGIYGNTYISALIFPLLYGTF